MSALYRSPPRALPGTVRPGSHQALGADLNDLLDAMTLETARTLETDLDEWGSVVVGMPREKIRQLLPTKRAERLHAWVREFGSASPLRWWTSRNSVPKHTYRAPNAQTHLIIPDCHAAPGQGLDRFTWLGRMIADINPSAVISLGDWYSLDSLCAHRTTAERSQDRTIEEINAGELALKALEAELGTWAGVKHITLGNHDDRLRQLSNDAPWLEGLLDVGAAHLAAGWKVHDFLEPLRIDGVRYQHFMPPRGSGKAIGGKFHALRLLERVMFAESVVVGHSHLWKHWTEAHLGRRIHAVVAGCYLEHVEEYAGEDNHTWWRGITVLRNVQDGDFDVETWSIDRIRDRYGDR